MNRKNYFPRQAEDFGDGGAFPEIHIAQYPLNMGKQGTRSSAIVCVDVDDKGQIRYDAIVKQGNNKEKLIQTSLGDIKEKKADADLVSLPTEDEELETAERTKRALEQILEGKIKQAKPSTVLAQPEVEEPTYIRYTPNPNAPG